MVLLFIVSDGVRMQMQVCPVGKPLLFPSVSCCLPRFFWSSEFYSSWRWGEMGSVGLQRRSTKCKLCLSPVRLHLAGIQRMLGFPQNPSSLTLHRCHLWALPRPACFSVMLLQSIVREKSRMRWGNTERICWHLTDPEWTITEDIFSCLQKKRKKSHQFFQVW